MKVYARHGFGRHVVAIAAILVSAMAVSDIHAQCGGGRSTRQSVGGVFIDACGVLGSASTDARDALRQERVKAMDGLRGDINEPTELRKVSLRMLDEALAEQIATGKEIPTEMRFLAGLQNIRYVFVYPDQQDIVIAGYGEGIKIDAVGNAVGSTSNQAVLLLDDLVVALRGARRAANGITCSIDPTQEGLKRLREYVSHASRPSDVTLPQIESALGPQTIQLGGIAPSTHFARVLVAADYRMKQIGMGHEKSQVTGLSSYLTMVSASGNGMQSMTPRWWMVPEYKAVVRDADGLAWGLEGSTVKTMTEETLFAADGSKKQAGKVSPAAQRWADQMTSKFSELARKDSIFGQLRNCMDLAVVSTLLAKEGLMSKAGVALSALMDPTQYPSAEYEVPKTVATKASALQKGSSYVISASGGVEIRPDEYLQKPKQDPAIGSLRAKVTRGETNRWWWN
jgi:hypothetical protein